MRARFSRDMARAIEYSENGGPEVLHLVDIDDPVAGEGQVVVRIEAAGVNPVDAKMRSGHRGGALAEPRRAGFDGAGVVTAVGEGVEGFREGDAVVLWHVPGTYASAVAADADHVFHRPPQVSAELGAAIGVPASTAYQALRSLDVGPGDTLLLHGGSGAVGRLVIQLAVSWGATVVATTSDRRADDVRALGAIPVAYGDGLADRVRAAAPQGVTVALDGAGTDEAIQASLDLVADRGRIATIVRGQDAQGFGIHAYSAGSPVPLTARQNAWRSEGIAVVLQLMAAGAITVELGPELPLADAVQAHRLLAEGTDGKILLRP